MPDVVSQPSKKAMEDWIFEALADSSRDAWWIAPALTAGLLVETVARGCPICQDDDQDV